MWLLINNMHEKRQKIKTSEILTARAFKWSPFNWLAEADLVQQSYARRWKCLQHNFYFYIVCFWGMYVNILKVNKNQLMGNTKKIHVLTTAMFLC